MQNRLDIHSRMKSQEEINFQKRIREKELAIKEEKKRLKIISRRLNTQMEDQQTRSLRMAERRITPEYIEQETGKIKAYIKRLQKDAAQLRSQTVSIQKASQKQSDMFNPNS